MEAMLNAAKLTFPSHLDQKLFEKAICSYEKDQSAKVLDFSIEPGSNLGDNFGSHVYRAKIKFTSKNQKGEKEISVIIKTLSEDMGKSVGFELDKYMKLFEVEIEMYEKVLTEISNLLGEEFWPRLIYSSMDLPCGLPVIFLEDINKKGFNLLLQTPPKDFETSKMALKKLAKFHAASFYLHHEQKCDFSHFNQTYHSDPNVAEMIVGNGLKGLLLIASESELYEDFLPALKNFRENFNKMTLESYKVQKGPFAFNVLNHADFHLKNVLWKGEGEKIEDICIFDYQICYYGSPAIDLSHALYFFLSDENRPTLRNELIAVYHAQFVESLKSFGYIKSIPSLLDLQIELLKNGNLQAMICFCYSIAFYFDFKTMMTPEDFADPVGLQRKIYGNENYQKMILRELPRFVFSGMI